MRRHDISQYNMLLQTIYACIILREPNGCDRFAKQDFILLQEIHWISA